MDVTAARRFFAYVAACAMLASGGGLARAKTLIPGGQSIGVTVKTQGLMVIGASDIGATPSPIRLSGIRPGDLITKVNGQKVTGVAQLSGMLTGNACDVTYLRGETEKTVSVTPANDGDGAFRLGAWVRGGTAGIGTLTFYDPESGQYGALGHAVIDTDVGILLPVDDGSIYENSIVNIEKGTGGEPGEILGQFYDGGKLGAIDRNTDYGIFGKGEGEIASPIYPDGVETAAPAQVRTGTASILTTVEDGEIGEYGCEIVHIEKQDEPSTRSFTLRVTDEALIDATGGIVQGMSGSPIIQDGRLIGAVTHVYVNDPTMGYGVYIDWMLDSAAA